MSKNQFGGSWTEAKMEIVVSYVKVYLTIMNKLSWAGIPPIQLCIIL